MARSANSAETPHVKLETPSHGRGKLMRGGNHGNKGGGRKPQAFTTFLKSLREDEDVQQAIRDAASDPASRGFGAVLKTITDYDTEKPAEKHAIVGPVEVRVRIQREDRKVTK